MSATVTTISERVTLPSREPVQDVIDDLEDLLAQARTGYIRQFACVAMTRDDSYLRRLSGDGGILVILGVLTVFIQDIARTHANIEDGNKS